MNKELIGQTITLDNNEQYMVLNVVMEEDQEYGFLLSLNDNPSLIVVSFEGDKVYMIKDEKLKNYLTEKYKNKTT